MIMQGIEDDCTHETYFYAEDEVIDDPDEDLKYIGKDELADLKNRSDFDSYASESVGPTKVNGVDAVALSYDVMYRGGGYDEFSGADGGSGVLFKKSDADSLDIPYDDENLVELDENGRISVSGTLQNLLY